MLFENDKIQNLRQLIKELKIYLEKQKEYTKLELTEKLTILFSTLIFAIILILLGMAVLFYISLALVHVMAPYVGGLTGGYAIMAGIVLLFALLISAFRRKLIINPIVNFIANLFLKNSK